jgi:hypothetical protein
VLLLDKAPLHPPEPLAVANHEAKAAFTAACDCPPAVVVFTGQVNITGGAAGTVNVLWQAVVNGAQAALV